MAVNRAFVGRTYTAGQPYEVGREKIREFAEAIGERADVIAPPTFPIVLSMRAESSAVLDPELGFDFSRVVHREQRFTYTRPVHAGDVLTVTVTLTQADTLGGNDLVAFQSEVATLTGEHICTTTTSLVSRAGSTP
jgi:acyl dehydratase